MKNKKTRLKFRRGTAIIYGLALVVMIGFLLSGLSVFISALLRSGYHAEAKQESFEVSEAGVFFYRWYLAHKTDGRTAQQIDNFWQTGNPIGVATPYEVEYSDPWGDAIGKYSISVIKPYPGSTKAEVTVQGWTYKYPSMKRTVKVRFRRPSWSEYAVLADDNIRFGAGTTVTGKIHSNKGIRFDGYANNIISSTLGSYDDPDHDDVGAEKLEFGVHTHVNAPPGSGINNSYRPAEMPPAVMPTRTNVFASGRRLFASEMVFNGLVSDLGYMRSSAAIKYDNTEKGRRIILKSNGTFDMCKVSSYDVITNAIGSYRKNSGSNTCSTCSGQCLTNTAIPNNGVIFVANNAWIEGTINNKKVTIVAAELTDEPNYTGGNKNIFLGINNLLYTNTDGKDIIGLFAQKDVEIIQDSLTNLTIDGALLAKEGRVGRDHYNDHKNSITVNGSIATKNRYGFAYTDGTGYDTRNLNFDNNLLYYPPPYFPTGTQYSIDLWEEL